MRLIFAGSPAAAVPSLRALAGRYDIATVLTREDAPRGRKRVLTPSEVGAAADELALPTVKANRLDETAVAALRAADAELGVIVAYGGLLREPLLSAPRQGWINLHFSLLPRWRGAAPVQHALIAGDTVTGVSVFRLVAELDAGPIFARADFRPGAHQTAGSLLNDLADLGAGVLLRVVDDIAAGTATPVDQSGEVTLAPKLTLDDARLRFSEDAARVYNRFRGVTPEPGAFGVMSGERVKIHELEPRPDAPKLAPGALRSDGDEVLVGTGTSPLRIVTIQPAGKRAMPASDWWRGLRDQSAVSFDG